MCGGTQSKEVSTMAIDGLSPRVRGNPVFGGCLLCLQRSIPACAGEPLGAVGITDVRRVYPRVCGGTSSSSMRSPRSSGLSPRVRGNPKHSCRRYSKHRSIPACAGEPCSAHTTPTRRTVYPRVCGGTGCCGGASRRIRGLSPRVRGNHCTAYIGLCGVGSIPACAGEP